MRVLSCMCAAFRIIHVIISVGAFEFDGELGRLSFNEAVGVGDLTAAH